MTPDSPTRCAQPHGRSAALPSLVDGPQATSLRRRAEHPVDATLATAAESGDLA